MHSDYSWCGQFSGQTAFNEKSGESVVASDQ